MRQVFSPGLVLRSAGQRLHLTCIGLELTHQDPIRAVSCLNPKGIPAQSPGLASRRAYPGFSAREFPNRNAVVAKLRQ